MSNRSAIIEHNKYRNTRSGQNNFIFVKNDHENDNENKQELFQ